MTHPSIGTAYCYIRWTPHTLPSRPLCPSTLTLQGESSISLSYSDWSDNESILLPLANSNILKIRLNFRGKKKLRNITGSR